MRGFTTRARLAATTCRRHQEPPRQTGSSPRRPRRPYSSRALVRSTMLARGVSSHAPMKLAAATSPLPQQFAAAAAVDSHCIGIGRWTSVTRKRSVSRSGSNAAHHALVAVVVLGTVGCRKGCRDTGPKRTTVLECRAGDTRVQIERADDVFIYTATPTGPAQSSKELVSGTQEHEGTGACAIRRWSFHDSADTFTVEDVGCTEQPPPLGTIAFHITTIAGTTTRLPCLAPSASAAP